jgi:PAS domain S-box-containing protein
VIVSDLSDEAIALQAVQIGAQDYLVKGQTDAQLLSRAVRYAIERRLTKQAEVALKNSEARFRRLSEATFEGILVQDCGRILDVNQVLATMFGYEVSELIGKHCLEIPLTTPEFLELMRKIFLSGDENFYEVVGLRKDGSTFGIEVQGKDMPEEGQLLRVLGVRDITQRQLLEIELRHSKEAAEAGSRAKSEFLATMSHELRTPLNAILGLCEVLGQELFGSLNAKQKEYIKCIHSSGEHLLELIQDILDLSKVEAGKEELTLVPLEVRVLCDYVIAIVRDRALAKGLQLTSHIDPQADVCIADERRVKQMLLNLLSNAIKFTQVGRVSLRIEKVPKGIAFTVVDTGIGIAPEQLELLFQPFKQLDSRLNRQYEGSGLGLALTRHLARLHGGDVTVESTLGEGSEFRLFLPERLLFR